jgi:fermentation-respiration switch protein FrsA (DUF1100 family)
LFKDILNLAGPGSQHGSSPSRGLGRITVPALVVHATADTGVYEADARALFDALAAPGKSLEFIRADHYLQEAAGSRDQAADLIAAWTGSILGT